MEDYLSIEYDKEMKRSFESEDHRYNVYMKLCYHSPEEEEEEEPLIQTVVLLNLDDEETCRDVMETRLGGWPVQTQGRRWLIDLAMKDARDLFQCIPPHHNTMMLLIRVRANHVNNYQEQEEEEEERVGMENKKMDCPICLDDILMGFYMPCFHVFHEGCIKKWLKTRHTCPVCRHQIMPS